LKFNVISIQHPQLADPTFWETIFTKDLTELKRLFLNILIFDSDHLHSPMWNLLADEEKVIERINKSNYWSSHQWKTTFSSSLSTSQTHWAKFNVV